MITPRRRWHYLDVSYPMWHHFWCVTNYLKGLEFSDIETRQTLTYL